MHVRLKVNAKCPNCVFCLYIKDFCYKLKSTSFIFFNECNPLFSFLLWSSRCRVLWLILLYYKWRGEGSEPQSRLQVRKNYTTVTIASTVSPSSVPNVASWLKQHVLLMEYDTIMLNTSHKQSGNQMYCQEYYPEDNRSWRDLMALL